MTHLYRYRTELTGFLGGPGIATHFFLDNETAEASLHTFWTAVSHAMPDIVRISVASSGDVIEDTTGELVGAWAGDANEVISGLTSGSFAAPAGACVRWDTSTILDGKRLRGRTFIIPWAGNGFDANGTLAATPLGTTEAAALELIIEQAESMVIWHRPFAGRAAVGSRPARAAHAGGHGLVTASSVPDKVVVLRSRRD
jgi:hypothetical protein